jgi:hypothetical protein
MAMYGGAVFLGQYFPIGVSVPGTVPARRVTDDITTRLAAAGVPAGGSTGDRSLSQLPEAMRSVVRTTLDLGDNEASGTPHDAAAVREPVAHGGAR